jgi:hypothetical protein
VGNVRLAVRVAIALVVIGTPYFVIDGFAEHDVSIFALSLIVGLFIAFVALYLPQLWRWGGGMRAHR